MLAETISTRPPAVEDLSFRSTVILTVVASIAAAAAYALAAVLQQEAAAQAPAHTALRLGLLAHLVRRRRWLAGAAADVAGFGLQMLSLSQGSLILVQALLVSGLMFALPIGAARSGRRMSGIDRAGVATLAAGLVALTAAQPGTGTDRPSAGQWAVIAAVTVLPALALVTRPGPVGSVARPVRLAVATGLVYGATAALTKVTADLLADGIGTAATSWQPYLLGALAAWSMLLNQSAFQAGPLAASLPTLTAAEPLVCAGIGVLVLHEHVPTAPALTGLAAVVAGIVVLTRSPLVLAVHEPTPVGVSRS
jgi:drug/metabolite transporter (DMT)-like permease